MVRVSYSNAVGMRPANTDPDSDLVASKLPDLDGNGEIHHHFELRGPAHIINDPAALRAALIRDKSLFFKTLEKLALKRHVSFSVEEGFPHIEDGFIGSATVICVSQHGRRYPEIFSVQDGDQFPGRSESTTDYLSRFGVVANTAYISYGKIPNGFMSPIYCIDDRVVHTISRNADTEKLLSGVLKSFARLAAMAEHDYIHALTLQEIQSFNLQNDEDRHHGSIYEKWSLALHAAVCAELFTNQTRKEAYLGWAADYFGRLEKLQSMMGDRPENREIITYLAEIGFHRVARTLSPDDEDFKNSRAAKIMDNLRLSRPKDLSDEDATTAGYANRSGREKLWIHAAMTTGGMASDFRSVYAPLHDSNLRFITLARGEDGRTIGHRLDAVQVLAYQQHLYKGGKPQEFRPYPK